MSINKSSSGCLFDKICSSSFLVSYSATLKESDVTEHQTLTGLVLKGLSSPSRGTGIATVECPTQRTSNFFEKEQRAHAIRFELLLYGVVTRCSREDIFAVLTYQPCRGRRHKFYLLCYTNASYMTALCVHTCTIGI